MGSRLAPEVKPVETELPRVPETFDPKQYEIRTEGEPPKPEDFGYLAVPDLDFTWSPETQGQKFWRKCKENPFVPIGLSVTVFALLRGILSMTQGTPRFSQKMMRLRVGAQGFTVVALLVGFAYDAQKRQKERAMKRAEREAIAEVMNPSPK